MPKICQLIQLKVDEDTNRSINFDFILEIKYLKDFQTNSQSSDLFYLAIRSYKKLKFFYCFEFQNANQETIFILRNEKGNFDLLISDQQGSEKLQRLSMNLNQLFEQLIKTKNGVKSLIKELVIEE